MKLKINPLLVIVLIAVISLTSATARTITGTIKKKEITRAPEERKVIDVSYSGKNPFIDIRTLGPEEGYPILWIGDSLSVSDHSPGGIICKELAEHARVYKNAIGGRSASSFWRGTGIKPSKNNPLGALEPGIAATQLEPFIDVAKIAFIDLGTNDASNATVDKNIHRAIKYHTYITTFLRDAHITSVLVTAPLFSVNNKYGDDINRKNDELISELAKMYDYVIDSRPGSKDILEPSEGRAKDYIHFRKGAKEYAEYILSEIAKLDSEVNIIE